MRSAMEKLLRSRKFLLLVMDILISTVLFFVGKYGTPQAFDDVKFLIALYQPLFLLIIAAIAAEDSAEKLGGRRARK